MSDTIPAPSLDLSRHLDEALAAPLTTGKTGQVPDFEELSIQYPELASELLAFHELRHRLANLVAKLQAGEQATHAPTVAEPITEALTGTPDRADSICDVTGGPESTIREAAGPPAARTDPDATSPVTTKVQEEPDLLAGETRVRYFGDYNEAEAVALLDHPHIVPIFEVGRYEEQRYFSMKLIDGPSLDQKLADYCASPMAAAVLVTKVAEAVHHAHQRGILHRDLKPSNILLDERNEPHVTDFGLAKRIEGDCELTQSGAILGTPAYMAPEQASGKRGAVTTATDIYGLGAVLYALLTGRGPFSGGSVGETLEHVRERTPQPPSRSNPQVPRDLEIICLKCMEKEPARRYTSARALADDLKRFSGGEPILAQSIGHLAEP